MQAELFFFKPCNNLDDVQDPDWRTKNVQIFLKETNKRELNKRWIWCNAWNVTVMLMWQYVRELKGLNGTWYFEKLFIFFNRLFDWSDRKSENGDS